MLLAQIRGYSFKLSKDLGPLQADTLQRRLLALGADSAVLEADGPSSENTDYILVSRKRSGEGIVSPAQVMDLMGSTVLNDSNDGDDSSSDVQLVVRDGAASSAKRELDEDAPSRRKKARTAEGARESDADPAIPIGENKQAEVGVWTNNADVIVYTCDLSPDGTAVAGNAKIAAFDLDDTISVTRSGKKFPTSETDWQFLNGEVATKIRDLAKTHKIVIFTNQGGKVERHPMLQARMGHIVDELGVPVQVFMASGSNWYRKPGRGMWEMLVANFNQGIRIDKSASFFVGDAAGRPDGWQKGRKKDFSCSDRKFAINVGIQFKTPEEFYLGHAEYKEYSLGFEPRAWRIARRRDAPPYLTPGKPASFPATSHPEMVLMVGRAGSGKSTYAKKFIVPSGYEWINMDTLKTKAKCIKAAKTALSKGTSVVIDNTNPDRTSRKVFLDIAKQHSAYLRVLVMECSMELALHFNSYRDRVTNGERPRVPMIAYHTFNKKFEEPSASEGIDTIQRVAVVPDFTDREAAIFDQFTS